MIADFIYLLQGRQGDIGPKGHTGNPGLSGPEVKIPCFLMMRVLTKLTGCILLHMQSLQQYIRLIIMNYITNAVYM